jgi:hypothetical protein
VRVSKVQSLVLDAIPLSTLEATIAVGGNARANSVWCEALATTAGWSQLRRDASEAERHKFVTAKYAWRGFVATEDAEGASDDALLAAVICGDALAALRCIARPAPPQAELDDGAGEHGAGEHGAGSGRGGAHATAVGAARVNIRDSRAAVCDPRVLEALQNDAVASRACRTLVLLNQL